MIYFYIKAYFTKAEKESYCRRSKFSLTTEIKPLLQAPREFGLIYGQLGQEKHSNYTVSPAKMEIVALL